MTSRLYELAALAVVLVLVGAILTAPDVRPESRAGAIVALIGGMLVVAAMNRRRQE